MVIVCTWHEQQIENIQKAWFGIEILESNAANFKIFILILIALWVTFARKNTTAVWCCKCTVAYSTELFAYRNSAFMVPVSYFAIHT